MESPNIKHVPLNPMGAVELGLSPCSVCVTGWGNYSASKDGKGVSETCHDTCKILKQYSEQQIKDEKFFLTHLKEAVKTLKKKRGK